MSEHTPTGSRKKKRKRHIVINHRKVNRFKSKKRKNKYVEEKQSNTVDEEHKQSIFSYCMTRNFGNKTCTLNTRTQYLPISCVKEYGTDGVNSDAIFNLEFSPDNKYLVAACDNRNIIVMDPCIHKKVAGVSGAHENSVNAITFLDNRTFATCSDDKTIALWDVRKLNSKFCSLIGHTNWVKSINYHPESNILISSAFDNTVRIWRINEYCSNNSLKSEKVMDIPFLTRTNLSYDFRKFVVATTTGLLFVIHNVDFSTLTSTIIDNNQTPSPEIYDNKSSVKPTATNNLIEFIKDFPLRSSPWCIASVQMHPYSWNVLSRYTCHDATEWSVVHNIQEQQGVGKQRLPRLQGYIEEPNVQSGYIKELCYNHDGTVICSPYANGLRLLAHTANCDPFPDLCTARKPRQLTELKFVLGHKSPVLTTRFAKHIPVIASGCLGGQVSFYQPKL